MTGAPISAPTGLLLAPGAGADRDQATLVALDVAASERGLLVERMDFPYRRAGRRAPDRLPVLVGSVLEAAQALRERGGPGPGDLVLGGRSMGGRVCSVAVAEGLAAKALLLISYPLHPPGKPERLRTEHFENLTVPCLFVSGTKDSFGTPAELETATKAIPGRVTHHWIEGKDHGLRRADTEVVEVVMAWLEDLPAG